MIGIRCKQCKDELILDGPHDMKVCSCKKCILEKDKQIGDYSVILSDEEKGDVVWEYPIYVECEWCGTELQSTKDMTDNGDLVFYVAKCGCDSREA